MQCFASFRNNDYYDDQDQGHINLNPGHHVEEQNNDNHPDYDHDFSQLRPLLKPQPSTRYRI